MTLEYDLWTGHITEVKESLVRSVAQYVSNNHKVKVGITNDPQRRKSEHERSDIKWKRMVIKYKTGSVNYINELERIVIDQHFDYLKNEVAGGGGPNGTGPYYLYVLLG